MSPFKRIKQEYIDSIESMIDMEFRREEEMYEQTGRWMPSCSSEIPRLQDALADVHEATCLNELYDVEY